MKHWILDEAGEPIEATTVEWAHWMEATDRTTKKTMVDDICISTVFLGSDHSFGSTGPPVLWETMIFGGEHDQYQERYSSMGDAEMGHEKAIVLVKTALLNPHPAAPDKT